MKTVVVLLAALALTAPLLAAQAPAPGASRERRALFAGGCFWCMEPPFENLDGVRAVISGYTGGKKANPSYEEVSSGGTGHVEAVQIVYDPRRVSFGQLLEVFWRQIDPTDAGGQFVDRGSQYRSAVFYGDEGEKRLAEASRDRLARSGSFAKPIVTEILPAGPFYPAEGYHQDYYKVNPLRYKYYRWGSGRDEFLNKAWGKERGAESAGPAGGAPSQPSTQDGPPYVVC